ncbi:hypothetical protein EDD11_008821 [Mortierella claussenii]|nr:hypothetical protein EDD11_008821 [Mortierella claussenii]
MAPLNNTRIVRKSFIQQGGKFTPENVQIETVPLDTELADGDVLIRNLYVPLEPSIAYSFNSKASTLRQTIAGFGIGEVVDSKHPAYPVKSIVSGYEVGWETYTRLSNPKVLYVIPDAHNPKIPLTEYVNNLGINGLTAFVAVEQLVKFKRDQVVYISSAAGSVAAFLIFLAKRHGAFVIGSAGSDEKVQYILNDLGVDAAINYKTQDVSAELDKAAPQGIDIYFDNVGGETLDIALEKLKPNGQVVAIGSISTLDEKTLYTHRNLKLIIMKALTINGFSAFQHLHRFPDFWKEFAPSVASGELKPQKLTILKGLEDIPQTYADYLDGKHHGKIIVEVATL